MSDTPFCDYVDISRQAYDELIERIERLERRNAVLEQRNADLERRNVELNQQVPPQTLITSVIHTPQMVNPIKEHFVSFSIESLVAIP